MAFDPLKAPTVAKPTGGTPDALKITGSSKMPDISSLTGLAKNPKWKAQPSVLGKADQSGAKPRELELDVPFQAVMVGGPKGSSKTIGSVDARNSWFFDKLREEKKLRTLVLSFDHITKQSLVSHFGQRMCAEKRLIGDRGVLSIEDIEREGELWLEENNVTVWELTRPIYSPDGEEMLYPGFDANIPETASFVIGETARIAEQYYKTARPHVLIVDHHQMLHEEVGTSHVLNMTGSKPGSKIKDFDWAHRTSAMSVLKHIFLTLPTQMVVSTGYGGEVKYRISVDGEDKRERWYDDPRWIKAYWRDYNVLVESSYVDPTDKEGAPVRDGPGRVFNMWVRSSQTPLVRQNLEVDVTGAGLSKIYEERRPKKKDEKK